MVIRYEHRGRKPPVAEKELLIETNLESGSPVKRTTLDPQPAKADPSTGWGTGGSNIFLITYYFFLCTAEHLVD